jgi:pimeloyl-ACP methyl ester carboxylesterase
VTACKSPPTDDARPAASPTLAEARRGFVTKLRSSGKGTPAPEPPPAIFHMIKYESPAGKLAAYVSPDPGDGRKHPAIVWITGGDCNTIDDLWHEAPRDNDQTAAAYRKAGIILMLPSLRGGNDNPGQHEGFFGEVDDVLAAADHLAHLPYVDPQRVYLGGHSTGGTLAMLVAETSDRFRATFSFGPVDDPRGYGEQYFPYDTSDAKEMALRTPIRWLASVRSPLFVIEGAGPGTSNIGSLKMMRMLSTNRVIRFLPAQGFNHFNDLAPVNELIAAKILRDEGPTTSIAIAESELNELGAARR